MFFGLLFILVNKQEEELKRQNKEIIIMKKWLQQAKFVQPSQMVQQNQVAGPSSSVAQAAVQQQIAGLVQTKPQFVQPTQMACPSGLVATMQHNQVAGPSGSVAPAVQQPFFYYKM